jgi:hypothetical protein
VAEWLSQPRPSESRRGRTKPDAEIEANLKRPLKSLLFTTIPALQDAVVLVHYPASNIRHISESPFFAAECDRFFLFGIVTEKATQVLGAQLFRMTCTGCWHG